MVLTIVATVATIAVPRYGRSLARYRLDNAARRLVADLAYASTLARVTSREIEIKFKKGNKPDESYYYFDEIEDPDHPSRTYTVVLRDEPYRVILEDAPNDLTFLFNGMPKDARTFVLVAGNDQRTITVTKESGEVTVQ